MAPVSTTRPEPLPAVRTSLLALAVIAGAQAVAAQEPATTASRVRSSSAPIGAAIALGVERSPMFRHRLAQIEATDGLVYVEEGTCGIHGVAACLVPRLVLAGPFRLLRVVVDVRNVTGADSSPRLATSCSTPSKSCTIRASEAEMRCIFCSRALAPSLRDRSRRPLRSTRG